MGFIIICDNCGREQMFHGGDSTSKGGVELRVDINLLERDIKSIDLHCRSEECRNNFIELTYAGGYE